MILLYCVCLPVHLSQASVVLKSQTIMSHNFRQIMVQRLRFLTLWNVYF